MPLFALRKKYGPSPFSSADSCCKHLGFMNVQHAEAERG